MIGPFSEKYQSLRRMSWDEMTDEQVDYMWRHNRPGGSIFTRAVFTILVFAISAASILLHWADTGLVIVFGVIILAPLVLMFYYDFDEREERSNMSRAKKIEAVETIQAIRRENSPI